MAAGGLAGACFAATGAYATHGAWLWLAGAACVQLRLIANMLDGMVAVLTDRCSPVGELFNEAPDRVSDTAILVGLGYAAGGTPTWGYAAALASMFTAYIRTACMAAGAPADFRGPMAKQHRMFVVTCLAIASTIAPADKIWANLCGVNWTATRCALALIVVGCLVTAWRRLAASGRHLRNRPNA